MRESLATDLEQMRAEFFDASLARIVAQRSSSPSVAQTFESATKKETKEKEKFIKLIINIYKLEKGRKEAKRRKGGSKKEKWMKRGGRGLSRPSNWEHFKQNQIFFFFFFFSFFFLFVGCLSLSFSLLNWGCCVGSE